MDKRVDKGLCVWVWGREGREGGWVGVRCVSGEWGIVLDWWVVVGGEGGMNGFMVVFTPKWRATCDVSPWCESGLRE